MLSVLTGGFCCQPPPARVLLLLLRRSHDSIPRDGRSAARALSTSAGNGEHDFGLYERLGVLKSAPADEIRAAFLQRAKQLHPDCNPSDPASATARFSRVQQAWAVLRDSEARREYDRRHGGEQAAAVYAASARVRSGSTRVEVRDSERAGGSRTARKAPAGHRVPVGPRRRQNKVRSAGGDWWGRADAHLRTRQPSAALGGAKKPGRGPTLQVNPAGAWWAEALRMELELAEELDVDVAQLVRRYQPARMDAAEQKVWAEIVTPVLGYVPLRAKEEPPRSD